MPTVWELDKLIQDFYPQNRFIDLMQKNKSILKLCERYSVFEKLFSVWTVV